MALVMPLTVTGTMLPSGLPVLLPNLSPLYPQHWMLPVERSAQV